MLTRECLASFFYLKLRAIQNFIALDLRKGGGRSSLLFSLTEEARLVSTPVSTNFTLTGGQSIAINEND